METWKKIPWTNGFYEVSDLGNVRSCDRVYPRTDGRVCTQRGKPLRPHWHDGYMRVRLNVPGFPKWHTVHKLVMEAFVGPRPEGLVIAHRDGDQSNNRLNNLRYATNSENQQDRRRHGTWHGETGHSLLTYEQVEAMRNARASGVRLSDLAQEYGVTMPLVSSICLGRTYKEAPGTILKPQPKTTPKKLTREQISEIVERRHAGEKIVPLGREFGVCHSYISKLYKENRK